MSLLPYAFARPFLFSMDPEAAHDLTLGAITKFQHTPLTRLYGEACVDDPVSVAGLIFPNRVGLAAGLDKNASCIDGLAAMGFGFVEVGTVTPKAQPGNTRPRMFRLQEAHALINRLGFNNEGLDVFLANVQQARFRKNRTSHPMLLGLNIGKNASTPIERATDDYLTCMDAVYPHADYVTVNISSPNTQNLRSLQSDQALDSLLAAVMDRREQLAQRFDRHTPVFLKIAPDLDATQIEVLAKTLLRYGTDSAGKPNNALGVIATNTTLNKEAVAHLPHGDEAGGLSGAPVFAASNEVIRQLRAGLGKEFPVIGVGGILSGEDAVTKIEAGADMVQIYTGLIYRGAALVKEAALAIKARKRITAD